MRIGFDGKFLPLNSALPARSGDSVHARELLRHLLMLDNDNRYAIYVTAPVADLQPKSNVELEFLSPLSRNAYFRNGIEYPIRMLRRPNDLLLSFYALPPLTRCKHLLFLTDISWVVHPEWLPFRYSLPRAAVTRLSVRYADRIVVPTEFTKSEVMDHLGVPEHKVTTIPLGTREQFFGRVDDAQIAVVKRTYRISGSYILSINDIHPRKNLEGLVDAFCHLKEKYGMEQSLVLAGRTLWNYPSFFRKVESARYKDYIVLTGYVPAEHVRPLYQGASLFVYPSFYEGWGLQIHEAMASGIPVAVTRQSSLSEIAGDAALQFDPRDSQEMGEVMYQILADHSLKKGLVEKGYQRIKQFSWRESARLTLKLCNELTQTKQLPTEP
jgi:glycosyltransferase involved in cell wall biosynthesis